MRDAAEQHVESCDWERATASYLDGELDERSAVIFESHAKECISCARALRQQRRLLCLLDNAFDESFERSVSLPRDFTRVVKARAQTDMSGVRSGRERSISLKICVGLALAVFALLGLSTFDAMRPLLDVASAFASALAIAARTVTDAGFGAMVLARAVGGRVVSDSNIMAGFQWVLFGCAIALLVLLIGRYHRASVND